MSEIRLAIRRLAKRPATTLSAIATLACAIGAAAATWSLLSAVLLRPLRVASPDRLVVVGEREMSGRDAGTLQNSHIYPVYSRIRESGVFEGVAAGGASSLLVGTGGRPTQQTVYFASHDFFQTLGVSLALGRTFTRDEDRRGAPLVAVLSDRFWRRAFDGDPRVVGRQVSVAGKPATIVGVAPRGFRGLGLSEAPDVYLPLDTVADVGSPFMNYFALPDHRSSPMAWVIVVGRLRADMGITQAEARLDTLLTVSGPHGAVGLTGVNTAAIPAAARPAMTQFGRLLGVTVALLLLIGCTTVGMLLLIRTEARREEFAMCLALGASRARLVGGVAIEGAVLSLAGAALALPITGWLFAGVRTFQLPGGVALDLLELGLDGRALAAAAGCAIGATLLIAVVAAAFGFSADVADALRYAGGTTARAGTRRTRTLLVTGQVAVAMVLLGGAALFARSVMAALSLNPGFETTRIVTGRVSLGPYQYTPARAAGFFDDLRGRLSANPAIRSVAFVNNWGGMAGRLIIDGEPRRFASTVAFTAIDPHYFRTIGVAVNRGRDFSADDREGSALVAIVSQSFGRALANGGDPIGRRITMPYNKIGQPPDVLQVVGVVPDLITSVTTLEPLVMYTPIAQAAPDTYRTLVVRAAQNADAVRREVLGTIRQIDRAVTPAPMLTIDERLAAQMGPQRFGALVMGALGFIAVLLTLVGSYVVAESMAVLRRREMAVRAALGARSVQLGVMVLAQTGRLVGFGLLCGLALAWMGASTIRALLFRIQPLDPITLASVAVLILLLSLAVSVRPALHVARVDLSRALREE